MEAQARPPDTGQVANNLRQVHERIAAAAGIVGRDPDAVALVAVSKVQPIERIRGALAAGHRIFGENRVQEAIGRWPPLRAEFPDLSLHLIGPLQTNKVRDAIALFDVIETVDRPRLAEALKREMDRQSRRLACFVQVNTGEEPQKTGIRPAETRSFVAWCRDTVNLDVAGLMCLPPVDDEPALHFALLRELARECGLNKLSMGMSGDYDVAIEFGATHVRVGTAIFGARTQP